jgi:hypothetical protein
MFDAIRRRLGLHVHEWDLVDSRVEQIERAIMPGRPGRGSGDFGPAFMKVPIEIVTYRCRTCGKETESRRGGI